MGEGAHGRPSRPQGGFGGSPPDNPDATRFAEEGRGQYLRLAHAIERALARRPQGGFGGSPPDNPDAEEGRGLFLRLVHASESALRLAGRREGSGGLPPTTRTPKKDAAYSSGWCMRARAL
jgi:hypothetical protein